MKKAVIYSLIIVAVCAFILRLCLNYANAGINVSDPGSTVGLTSTSTGSIVLKGVTIAKICKYYDADTGSFWVNLFDDDTDTYLATSSLYNFAELTYEATPANCLMGHTFVFPEAVAVTDGTEYQIQIHRDDNAVFYVYDTCDGTAYKDIANSILAGNYYGDIPLSATYCGYMDLITSEDYYASTTVIAAPTWDGEVYVGAEGANIPTYVDCFINQTDCQTWLKYRFDDIGKTAYLSPYNLGGYPDDAVASSVLTQKLIMKEYFDLPVQTEATTTRYCVYIDDESEADDDLHLCFTTVYYTDENDLGLPVYDIESACDDVATSSGSTWDDMRYGLECAFRKVVYWSFTPQPESIQKIRETYEDSKTNFPISVYTEYQATFEAIGEYQGTDLTIPVGVWKDQYKDYESLADITLGTSTLLSVIDEDFYDDYYLYAQIILYLIGAFYVFYRLINLNNRETE